MIVGIPAHPRGRLKVCEALEIFLPTSEGCDGPPLLLSLHLFLYLVRMAFCSDLQ